MEAVGLATWDELTPAQRLQCCELGVWKSEAYDKWISDRYKTDKRLKQRVKDESGSEVYDQLKMD